MNFCKDAHFTLRYKSLTNDLYQALLKKYFTYILLLGFSVSHSTRIQELLELFRITFVILFTYAQHIYI